MSRKASINHILLPKVQLTTKIPILSEWHLLLQNLNQSILHFTERKKQHTCQTLIRLLQKHTNHCTSLEGSTLISIRQTVLVNKYFFREILFVIFTSAFTGPHSTKGSASDSRARGPAFDPGLATYFHFSFCWFKKGSRQ